MSPPLAVVVATYNRLAHLRRCLDSIAAHSTGPHEVIVVDAGSTDGTREYLAERGDVRVIAQAGLLGLPRAYNEAWRELECEYTCWLSDDLELVAGGLDLAVSVLDSHPEVGMVGLKMRDAGVGAKPYGGAISRYGILNCNHGVIRLGLLRDVGYFHEGYRAYMVDPDLTAAVLSAGATVVMTKPVVLLHDRTDPLRREERELLTDGTVEDPARALYATRYRYLDRPRPVADRLLGGVVRVVLRGLLAGAPAKGARFGLNRRDQYVLGTARFVSPLDAIRSARGPVHLAQRAPTSLLLDEANPYRELAVARRRSSPPATHRAR
jgi:glycosyltransferase involved in cell wall biosynthesis